MKVLFYGTQRVLQVETIADQFMVVSDCPEIVEDHALAVSRLALDLVDRCEQVDDISDANRALKVGFFTLITLQA